MMSDNKLFPLSEAAQRYAWQQLARRIGLKGDSSSELPFAQLGVQVTYGYPQEASVEVPTITVVPSTAASWWQLTSQIKTAIDCVAFNQAIPPLPLSELCSCTDGTLPVLLWGGSPEEQKLLFALGKDRHVIFFADIVASTVFMLSRWEETVSTIRDRHGRFPVQAGVAKRLGILDRPLIDEYAMILGAWLQWLVPTWNPPTKQLTVKLSHDIDWLTHFSSFNAGAKRLTGDLIKRRSVQCATDTMKKLYLDVTQPEQTLPMRGIHRLAQLSHAYGFQSAFYFMAAQPSDYDSGYAIDAIPIRRTIERLQRAGHEIGFHPSYFTLDKLELLAQEKERLETVVGAVRGGRQHYLRFRASDTWHHWEAVGLSYDSTLGYAEEPGFRCGTCHPFPVFDLAQDQTLNLVEIPLIVMDVTLAYHKTLHPFTGLQIMRSLAKRCAAVGGVFTLLWHNTSFGGPWQPWESVYETILGELTTL